MKARKHLRLAGLLGALLHNGMAGAEFTLQGTVVSGGGRSSSAEFALQGMARLEAGAPATGGGFALTGGLVGVYVVPGPVALLATPLDSGDMRLSWSAEAAGYTLQFSDALGADTLWQPVELPPGERAFVTPANRPARFFRLQRN